MREIESLMRRADQQFLYYQSFVLFRWAMSGPNLSKTGKGKRESKLGLLPFSGRYANYQNRRERYYMPFNCYLAHGLRRSNKSVALHRMKLMKSLVRFVSIICILSKITLFLGLFWRFLSQSGLCMIL